MASKGNIPAKHRRLELAELQAAANKINMIVGSPSDSGTPGHHPSCLWDALDIDGGALHLDLASSSTHLTSDDAQMFGVRESIQGPQWLWPGVDQQDMSIWPDFDNIPR